jgi:hypothetical protein
VSRLLEKEGGDRISVEMSRPHERATSKRVGDLDRNEPNRRGHLPKPPKDEIWIQVQVRDGDGNWAA